MERKKLDFVVCWINSETRTYGKTIVKAENEVMAKLYWKAKHKGRQWQWITVLEN